MLQKPRFLSQKNWLSNMYQHTAAYYYSDYYNKSSLMSFLFTEKKKDIQNVSPLQSICLQVITIHTHLTANLKFLFKTVSLKDHITLSMIVSGALLVLCCQSQTDSAFFKNNQRLICHGSIWRLPYGDKSEVPNCHQIQSTQLSKLL